MTPMQTIYWKINNVGLVKQHDDWVALLKQAKDGGSEAIEKLIMNCVPTVIKFAWKKMVLTGRYDLYEDLFQEGVKGVVQAFHACNVNRDCFFLTYATYWIDGQMTNFLRKSKTVSLPCHHQKNVTISTISIDFHDDKNKGFIETMGGNIQMPDAYIEAAEKENLKKCLRCLPEQERKAVEIIWNLTGENTKIAEYAGKMRLHRNTIRKRAKRGFAKLCIMLKTTIPVE